MAILKSIEVPKVKNLGVNSKGVPVTMGVVKYPGKESSERNGRVYAAKAGSYSAVMESGNMRPITVTPTRIDAFKGAGMASASIATMSTWVEYASHLEANDPETAKVTSAPSGPKGAIGAKVGSGVRVA